MNYLSNSYKLWRKWIVSSSGDDFWHAQGHGSRMTGSGSYDGRRFLKLLITAKIPFVLRITMDDKTRHTWNANTDAKLGFHLETLEVTIEDSIDRESVIGDTSSGTVRMVLEIGFSLIAITYWSFYQTCCINHPLTSSRNITSIVGVKFWISSVNKTRYEPECWFDLIPLFLSNKLTSIHSKYIGRWTLLRRSSRANTNNASQYQISLIQDK